MLSPDRRLRLDTARAAAKVIDGEAIVIDVLSGRYYSLEGAGELAWTLLAAGASPAEAAAALGERYEVDEATALADLEPLVAELVEEGLLVEAEDGAPAAPDREPPAGGRLPYRTPTLAVFRDMEDLLAFDPPLPATDTHVWQADPERG